MAAGTVRQFAAFGAGASVGAAPTNVYFLTGSQSNLWINKNRPNLYRETDTTQFKDGRWFNGGGNFPDVGYIVGANTSWAPTTGGGGEDSYVFVWGFQLDPQQNITGNRFYTLASYITGTSYTSVVAATQGLTAAGYYYGYDIAQDAEDFQETNLTGALPG